MARCLQCPPVMMNETTAVQGEQTVEAFRAAFVAKSDESAELRALAGALECGGLDLISEIEG